MINSLLLDSFIEAVDFDPTLALANKEKEALPVDFFDFYNSVSSVYSSKIEGEDVDFDSFYKHKFLNVEYELDYTKRSDDLFSAYQFIQASEITKESIFHAHRILSTHLLPEHHRGTLRTNPMYVINENDRIDYVACSPYTLSNEFERFCEDLSSLRQQLLSPKEVFYYAAIIHLSFVKIHPFQDGNGRMGRLLEKWFLIENLGGNAVSVELEKNYFVNRSDYYSNIKKLGLDFEELDWSKSLDFLLMTVCSLKNGGTSVSK